jgi:hypothetical protein
MPRSRAALEAIGQGIEQPAAGQIALDAVDTDNYLADNDVAPNFYPATIGVWRSVIPCWAVMAAVRGAEPSVERSAAERRCTA